MLCFESQRRLTLSPVPLQILGWQDSPSSREPLLTIRGYTTTSFGSGEIQVVLTFNVAGAAVIATPLSGFGLFAYPAREMEWSFASHISVVDGISEQVSPYDPQDKAISS